MKVLLILAPRAHGQSNTSDTEQYTKQNSARNYALLPEVIVYTLYQ